MPQIRHSPLHHLHARSGAAFEESRGWLLPKNYGDANAEYQALRTTAGILDRSNLGKIGFAGKDACDYLQRMTSNEVRQLPSGQGCYNTLLTDRGKMIADFRLYRLDESVQIDLDSLCRQPAMAILERFIIMDDVKITDLSDSFGIIGIYGPHAAAFLSSMLRLDLPPMVEFRHFAAFYAGEEVRVTCQRFTGEEGFEVWTPATVLESFWTDLLAAAPSHGARPVGLETLNVVRVEAGVPLFSVDMDENTIPLEAGLDHAVNLKKGCYVGQEILSRIHHQGHINRKLTGLKFEGSGLPARGDEIRDGQKKVGNVTSAVFSPALGCGIGLSILRREYLEAGRAVSVASAQGLLRAQVASLPFVPRKSFATVQSPERQ